MEAPERMALMFVRVLGAALIGWGIVDIALYIALCQHNGTALAPLTIFLKSLSLIAGVAILIKSKSLAEWLAETLDL